MAWFIAKGALRRYSFSYCLFSDFLITSCNRGSMSQGNPGDGTLNLYICTGCNSSMCLACGSLNVTKDHFFGQVRITFVF